MSSLQETLLKIEELRQILKDLFEKKGKFDQELINRSKELDEELNKFYVLIDKDDKKGQ